MRSVMAYKDLNGRGKTEVPELKQVQGLNMKECKVEGVAVAPNVPVQGANHGTIKVQGHDR